MHGHARELRTPRERTLFGIMAAVSTALWLLLVVGTLGVGLFYGVFIGAFILVAQALFLARVTGNGVRISEQQLPELHRKIVAASQKLGLHRPPEAYVIQEGGALNAFATKLLSRHFIVLYSDLLDACDVAPDQETETSEVDFVIAHEVGHLACGHLAWNLFLAPARMVPLLGAAYSRACEYSCDRCGYAVVGDLNTASRALTLLAAGGRYGRRVNLGAFVAQAAEAGTFWMAINELGSSHPYLSKRVAALRSACDGRAFVAARRPVLAYMFAPLLGAGLGGGLLAALAIMGILAALAIPAFNSYMERAQAAEAAAFGAAVVDSPEAQQQVDDTP